ncbi:MAG: NAD-dependent epimerase/dehydratase family protein [bacterium]|nr:NAD-dependent epimerase/dehydratase family protein [bacterium]
MFNKVLVTGGLGFIGSHLTEKLLKEGAEVVIIDNKSTNVVNEDYFKKGKCTVITKSVKETDLSKIKNVDIVFHLASILGPTGVLRHAGNIGIVTLGDTIKMRDFCLKKEIPLIDISTSEVYGHTGLLREESEKVFPGQYQVRTEYGGAKMLAEMALVNLAKFDSRLKYHIIRPFNVAGPRQKPDGGFVLPRFVIAALTGQPLTVYGDGSSRRAFTHVTDICDAILTIAKSKIINEIWNIGNPNNEMSIKEMAALVIKITKKMYPDKNPKMDFVDPKKLHGGYFAEVVDKIPYIKKISSLTGWKPKYSAKQVFAETIDFYAKKVKEGYYFKVS